MRTRWIGQFLFGFLGLIAAAGCEELSQTDVESSVEEINVARTTGDKAGLPGTQSDEEALGSGSTPKEAAKESGSGCADWRWIKEIEGDFGTLKDKSCQDWVIQNNLSSNWKGTLLSKRRIMGIGEPGTPASWDMGFCVFEYREDLELLAGDLTKLSDAKAERMCLNVISAGTALDEATGESWQEEFRKQVGRIDLPLAHPAVGAAKPWLTVVDDLPTSQAPASISASERNGKHGHTLANMARDLLCKDDTANDATCVASVRSRLALAHKCFDSAMNLGKDCQVKTTRDGKAIDSSANRKGGFSDTGILQDRDWLRDLVLRTMNKGGHVGFPGDVAEAINDEVDAWRSLNVNTRPSLILNLSLGWLPSSGGTQLNLDDMPIEMQAVYRALEKASCYGAIVVAAGGNRLFGPGEFDGPWLPAAWEKRRAPSHWECSTMYNEDPLLEEEEIVIPCPPEPSSSSLLPASRAPNSPPPPYPPPSNLPTPYRPLIYSVGGLNALGKPLAIGNELAMPRLAAYGDHAVAMGRADGKLLSPMTGTSVSALVVSSAAAAARYYQPKLYSHNIMQVLWDSGAGQENDMGLLADYCQSASKDPRLGDCGAVHRVTIGAAARKACEQWSSGCLVSSSSFPPLPKWERELPDLEQLSSLSADVDITCTPAPNYDVEIPDLWSKWGPKYRLAGTHEKRRSPPKDVEITCTSDDYYGIDAPDIRLQPWVHPQPGDPYCIFCVLDISANNAYLSLSNPYDSKIDNVSLIVGSQTLSLHGVEVEPSKTTPVLSVKIDNLKSDTPVFITANVNGMSTTNPIAIVK